MTTEALVFKSSPIITFGYIIQIFFSLLIILALLYVGSRYILPKIKTANSGKYIQLLDRVYLEPQVSAHIIKVGPEAWLIGISNKNITKIDKVTLE